MTVQTAGHRQISPASGGGFAGGAGRKYLEKSFSALRLLQAIEIPQNGQRNVWKCLVRKGLDLEMLGKKACSGRRWRAATEAARSTVSPSRSSD